MKVAFVYAAFESIGLESLSAILKDDGVETRLFFDPLLFDSYILKSSFLARRFSKTEAICRQILDYAPDVVCFSVVSDNYPWACGIAEKIKAQINVPVIFGGPHPTAVPERVLQKPFVDYVIVGEGDFAMRDLLRELRSGRRGETIFNVYCKVSGEIKR